jgi:phosphopantetheinyl transferase
MAWKSPYVRKRRLPLNDLATNIWIQQKSEWTLSELDSSIALLNQAERKRMNTYAHQEFAQHFVLGRALIRTAVAKQTGTAPQDWNIVETSSGQLILEGPKPVHVSLSRSKNIAICALSTSAPIGIDLEWIPNIISEPSPLSPLIRELLPCEIHPPRNVPIKKQSDDLHAWTELEAKLKYFGFGLKKSISSDVPSTLPQPQSFHFNLNQAYHICVATSGPRIVPQSFHILSESLNVIQACR